MPSFHRFLMAYGVTDEIFGVSVCHLGTLNPFYSYRLMSAAVPGWTLGTLLGALSGSLLPERLLNALGVALLSMTASFAFTLIPVLNTISSGFKIILLTLAIAGGAALICPVKEEF